MNPNKESRVDTDAISVAKAEHLMKLIDEASSLIDDDLRENSSRLEEIGKEVSSIARYFAEKTGISE